MDDVTQKVTPATVEDNMTVVYSDAPQPPAVTQDAAPDNNDGNKDATDSAPADDNAKPNADDASAEPKEQKQNRFQKRIDRLTKEKSELARKVEELSAKNGAPASSDGEPDVTDFEEYDDYLAARDAYRDKKQGGNQNAKSKDEQPSSEVVEAKEIIYESFADAREKYSDFDAVVTAKDIAITNDMVVALAECDEPTDVLYYIAKHKAKSHEIAALSPRKQAIEFGKIEAMLAAKPLKSVKASAAPEPIKPVGGGGGVIKTIDKVTSQREFEEIFDSSSKKRGDWI